MGFSHYPKTVANIVFAGVQPAPPDFEREKGKPDFLGRSFSKTNLFREPLVAGSSAFGYHDAQPFTRFYGSVACDQPLDVSLAFSNDEVDAGGHPINDVNIRELHYDAFGDRKLYDPARQEQTGRLMTMIFGRWIRIEIKMINAVVPSFLRLYVRGSVF